MRKGFWVIVLFLTTVLTGCLKDDPEVGTIVLMGSESYVKPIEEVIPDTLLSYIESETDLSLVHKGNMPPNIQGEYAFAPRELIKTNAALVASNDTLLFRFGGDSLHYDVYGQHNRVVSCDFQEKSFPLVHVDAINLMGHGSYFTAYFVLNYEHIIESGADISLKRAVMISGKVNSSGNIDHAIYAFVNQEIIINSNDVAVSGVEDASFAEMKDNIYIYRVKDGGSAVKHLWYHH